MHLGCVCLANLFVIVASSLNISTSSVVSVGDKVEMNCSVTGSGLTTWTYTSWSSSTEREIYSGVDIFDLVKSRYSIDKNISGQHNLIIDSVDLAHAGRYKCTSGIQKTLRTDIQLVVLDGEPKCDTNTSLTDGNVTEHSYLWVWCRVNYTGNVIPIVNMTKENSRGDITEYTGTTDYYTVSLTTTATVITQLNSDDNGAKIKFQITFQLSNSSIETALNLYSYSWNYTATVLYGPRNLSIVRLEDRLLCVADGNPNPTYKWTNFEANISTYGPVHLLNYTMESNRNYTIQCEATNAVVSERTNISHFQGSGDKYSSKERDVMDFLITALAIGVSLLFLLMTAIVVSCIIHKKRLKDNTSHRPDVALHTDASSYDGIALSSQRSPNNIMKGDHLPGKSGESAIADNAVYAQVVKPKGPSKGNKGGNIGDSSRPQHAPKDVTGADGTVYAELSGVKPPDRKGKAQVPKTAAFNKVEIYASIDHCGNASAPPLPPK